MNFREKLGNVLQLLKLSDKAMAKQLTSEDIVAIATRYQKEFQANLREDMEADSAQQQQQMSQDEMNQLQSLLAGVVTPPAVANNGAEKEEKSLNQPEATPEGVIELAKSVVKQNGELQNLVKQMSDQTAADAPSAVVRTPVTMRINGPGTTAKHFVWH